MDVTADRPRRPAYRSAAAAVGALSAASLADCAEADSAPSAGSDGQAESTRSPAGTAAESGTDDGGPATRGDGATQAGCDDETLDELEAERLALEEQLIDIQFEVGQLRTGANATEYLLDQVVSGFPADTLDRGRKVGLEARSSVVTLEILEEGFSAGQATAWFVDDGYLFTNAHNVFPVGPDSEFECVTQDGDRFDVEVVELFEDMQPDVALLRTGYTGATTLPLADVDGLAAGQPLVQVGHPGEVGYWVISMGRFIEGRPNETRGGTEYTELTSVVPGRPGVSGSPVLTLDGAVVGMTHGGEPVLTREPGAAARVAPDIVFDGPIGAIATSLHVGSDVLKRKLEDWR